VTLVPLLYHPFDQRDTKYIVCFVTVLWPFKIRIKISNQPASFLPIFKVYAQYDLDTNVQYQVSTLSSRELVLESLVDDVEA